MSFSGWKRRERIWTSVYLQNLVNTTTASVFPLEIVPVEILIQILFLLQMIILQCKHSNTILIYASFPCHAIQHITFFQLSIYPCPDLISPGHNSFIPKTLPHFWQNPTVCRILEGWSCLSSWRGCHRALAQELWCIRPPNIVPSHTHTSHFLPPQLPPFSSTVTGTYGEVC